jgi:hypothetical protein
VEWFDPEIPPTSGYIAIEGLFTNREGSHQIKLSRSVSHGSEFTFNPVTSATVYIEDSFGNRIDFTEQDHGRYLTLQDAVGVVGGSYTLTIETAEGEVYRSDPQVMEPPIVVDSMEVAWEVKEIYAAGNDGETTLQQVEGVDLFAEVHSNNNSFPKVRFETILLVQYVLSEYGEDPDFLFCRVKKNIDENVNITLLPQGTSSGSAVYHNVGFVKRVFPINPPEFLLFRGINRRIVILRQYSLNQESYSYYKELRNQLEAEGTLFDPMPSQLKGNIRCVTDPSKKALGFFEVSSIHSESFVLSNEPLRPDNLSVRRVDDLDHLADFDSSWELLPEYWILF